MPTYTYECLRCEHAVTVALTLAEHEIYQPRHCRKPMYQVMFAPMITADIQPYKSMITGERIAGRSQHREHLHRHGCVELGNEVPKSRTAVVIPRASRREKLSRQLGDMSDKQADKILKQLKKEFHG